MLNVWFCGKKGHVFRSSCMENELTYQFTICFHLSVFPIRSNLAISSFIHQSTSSNHFDILIDVHFLGLPHETLLYIGAKSVEVPADFNVHPHLKKTHIDTRLQKLKEGTTIDWATAEALALGSLLFQGGSCLQGVHVWESFTPPARTSRCPDLKVELLSSGHFAFLKWGQFLCERTCGQSNLKHEWPQTRVSPCELGLSHTVFLCIGSFSVCLYIYFAFNLAHFQYSGWIFMHSEVRMTFQLWNIKPFAIHRNKAEISLNICRL